MSDIQAEWSAKTRLQESTDHNVFYFCVNHVAAIRLRNMRRDWWEMKTNTMETNTMVS
jgi:hypothetical protein